MITPIDEKAARAALASARQREIEAVSVCLLWATANPAHELALGMLIEEEMPGVPYSLSHKVNPIVREYRRASSTAIDASLRPLMQRHLPEIASGLESEGFAGELLAATSAGGAVPIDGPDRQRRCSRFARAPPWPRSRRGRSLRPRPAAVT